jgi:UDP-2-acetamido-3-amino-2,3-dideoxy-glucuronate N-acetyltransferase
MNAVTNDVMIHPKALVESDDIGEGTRVWAFARVMAGAKT